MRHCGRHLELLTAIYAQIYAQTSMRSYSLDCLVQVELVIGIYAQTRMRALSQLGLSGARQVQCWASVSILKLVCLCCVVRRFITLAR